jgi:hypothetical protein
MANDTVNLTELSDVSAILRLFEEHHVAPTFDPVPYLSRYVLFVFLQDLFFLIMLTFVFKTG